MNPVWHACIIHILEVLFREAFLSRNLQYNNIQGLCALKGHNIYIQMKSLTDNVHCSWNLFKFINFYGAVHNP